MLVKAFNSILVHASFRASLIIQLLELRSNLFLLKNHSIYFSHLFDKSFILLFDLIHLHLQVFHPVVEVVDLCFSPPILDLVLS